jgi:hypothetical protein
MGDATSGWRSLGAHAVGLPGRAAAEAKAAVALQPDNERIVLAPVPLQTTDRGAALDALKHLLDRAGASSDVRLAMRACCGRLPHGRACTVRAAAAGRPKNPDLLTRCPASCKATASDAGHVQRYLELIEPAKRRT